MLNSLINLGNTHCSSDYVSNFIKNRFLIIKFYFYKKKCDMTFQSSNKRTNTAKLELLMQKKLLNYNKYKKKHY